MHRDVHGALTYFEGHSQYKEQGEQYIHYQYIDKYLVPKINQIQHKRYTQPPTSTMTTADKTFNYIG